ncbi:hypothetical protein PFICI_00842 [Pestalotiopsis fici W106-1]|uniref:Uncharacterized protein n=1 Tax=Pestalotiopsis fici (strain W106-1 / CGMCC3.15140) TaxID=1229662 RepID=W3XLZ1_PESFW|nr:uncharacterized protein PFICI_00842 [Pestalotiopsis fici W106-1]ETS87014.1 hypothetical protein PFICI_00842 [Pestalotiopsis fici W106-1]
MSPSSKKSKKAYSSSTHSSSHVPVSSAVTEQWVHTQAVEGPWDNIAFAAGTWPSNVQSSSTYAESVQASQGSVKHSHKHEHHKKSGGKK